MILEKIKEHPNKAEKISDLCLVDNIRDTEIRSSAIHGLGLFSTRDIGAGNCLAELDGQVVPYQTYYEEMRKDIYTNDVISRLFVEWNAMPNGMLLARMFRTKYSYINHSRKPNCKLLGFPPKIWSTSDILIGDEITLDYRDEPLPQSYKHGHGASYL